MMIEKQSHQFLTLKFKHSSGISSSHYQRQRMIDENFVEKRKSAETVSALFRFSFHKTQEIVFGRFTAENPNFSTSLLLHRECASGNDYRAGSRSTGIRSNRIRHCAVTAAGTATGYGYPTDRACRVPGAASCCNYADSA